MRFPENLSFRKMGRNALFCSLIIIGFMPAVLTADVDFTASPRSGNRPLVVTFQDRSDYSAAYTRVWSFPGATPSSATGLTVTPVRYEAAGTYTATLEIQMNGQPVGEKSMDIYVYELIDFGDAPDDESHHYRTLAASDGASHIINNVYLGSEIDTERDGQPGVGADLDDVTDEDDEDGVHFVDDLIPGTTVSITVEAHNAGFLNAWFDWGQDGSWAEAEDHSITDEMLANGTNTVTLTVPASAAEGVTYARFRYSALQGTNWYGQVFNGEVEDYLVYVTVSDMDYGDAPEPYPTTQAEDGARHPLSPALYLGSTGTDSEDGTGRDATATWDDDHGVDDEDGLSIGPLSRGMMNVIAGTINGFGYLHLWIDYNADGDWDDPGEKVLDGSYTDDAVGLTITRFIMVPADAALGITYARARYSHDASLGVTGVGGPGEVEDYQVLIQQPYDFGDAPDPYPTLIADGGARHPLSTDVFLGTSATDAEDDGIPDVAALGDDDDNIDDEDGVTISMIPPSGDVDIPIIVHGRGYLHAWIDFNRNGSWDDAGEKIIDGVPLSTGTWTYTLTIPAAGVVSGHSFARFRYSSDISLGSGGLGSAGEVEDYLINIGLPDEYDYGDAPASYGDPRHPISASTHLGATTPDAETGTQYSENADGDDLHGEDDEDGVMFPEVFVPGGITNVDIHLIGPGSLNAFCDWNQDGDFDDIGEGPFSLWVDMVGPSTISLAIPVPADALDGETYARFRFEYPDGPVDWGPEADSPSPTDEGDPGEVEDYVIEVYPMIEMLNSDYGDVPNDYEDGDPARHSISEDIYLGDMPDPEIANQESLEAVGDDINHIDDENIGIGYIFPGAPYNIVLTAHLAEGITGYLNAWIDFNMDHDWNDPDEHVINDLEVTSTDPIVDRILTAPEDALLGLSYVRVRFSLDPSVGYNGDGGDGEVEDQAVLIMKDFGDAPSSYTPAGESPASHTMNVFEQYVYLGEFWDAETYYHASPAADGDDVTYLDDEDGIILGMLVPGFPAVGIATVNRFVFTDPNMYLNGWIDFNQDGDWNDVGEHVVTDQVTTEGDHFMAINVPGTAVPGETFARFRLSEESGVGANGFGGVGEVEDYQVNIVDFNADFGDAPDPDYPTLLTHGGAWHEIVEGVHMGDGVSAESDGQPDPQAQGDSQDDGVTFIGPFIPGEPYTILMNVSVAGFISAWGDFNGDGDWTDCGDWMINNGAVGPGDNIFVTLMPPTLSTDKIYFRFRFSTARLMADNPFWGGCTDGEVEDYMLDLGGGSGAPLGMKWSQPPLFSTQSFFDSTYWGWDEKSVYGDTLMADNWFCGDNRAIKGIRWWGSYKDWDAIFAPPEAPDSFHVAIWSDDPIDALRSQSQPDEVIWETTVARSQTTEVVDGQDFYPGIMMDPDSVFQYQIDLSGADQFIQEGDSTYFWLSISAVYNGGLPDEHVWGWTTRETYFLPDAVQIINPGSPVSGSSYEEGETLKTNWDCAFELLSDLAEYPYDFGDAPDPDYPTSLAGNGAHHYIWPGTALGEETDEEPNSVGDASFAWDDLENLDDEDGIAFHDTLYDAGSVAFLTVTAESYSILNAWADYNGDGDWDDFGERVFIDMPCIAGNTNLAFNIPSGATAEKVGMRFRLAPVGGLRSTGIAIGGEVEDYILNIHVTATAVEEEQTEKRVPGEFKLMNNYPNPFNPTTTIEFLLPEMAEVKIAIFDILGRHVRTLVHGDWSAGSHAILWDGKNDRGFQAASGVYIYRIECLGHARQKRLFVESKKMMLVK